VAVFADGFQVDDNRCAILTPLAAAPVSNGEKSSKRPPSSPMQGRDKIVHLTQYQPPKG
jgi:hypothetical protein